MLIIRVLVGMLLCGGVVAAESIRVGAAISLKDAMDQIVKAYESATGDTASLVYGSSGQIAGQIASGAEIDVFISAANKQVDDLASRGLVAAESRRVVAGNSLVLIAPADAKNPPPDLESLAQDSVKRVAIGEPRTVPAGDYALQVLRNLKLDEKLKGRLVYGTNVRQVLSYVERGEVDAGIVYITDARLSGEKVKVIDTARAELHEPIVYPAVVVKASAKPAAAARFLEYLASPEARTVLRDMGFTAAPEPAGTGR